MVTLALDSFQLEADMRNTETLAGGSVANRLLQNYPLGWLVSLRSRSRSSFSSNSLKPTVTKNGILRSRLFISLTT
jgi:hypothetical protein